VSDRSEIIQVGAALSKRADKFLAKHPDKVDAVKRLFTLRLAHVPRQGEPVRARWERDAKQGADPAVDAEWALVERLAGPDWRLIVTGEKDGKASAEVAHEILFKTWPTLKRWLEDERDFLIWRGELDARRKEYDRASEAGTRQQRQALLMGLPLDTAKKWLVARRGDIEPAGQAFIEASVRAERAVARNRQRAGGYRSFDARHDREPSGHHLQGRNQQPLVRADHPATLHRNEFHAMKKKGEVLRSGDVWTQRWRQVREDIIKPEVRACATVPAIVYG